MKENPVDFKVSLIVLLMPLQGSDIICLIFNIFVFFLFRKMSEYHLW